MKSLIRSDSLSDFFIEAELENLKEDLGQAFGSRGKNVIMATAAIDLFYPDLVDSDSPELGKFAVDCLVGITESRLRRLRIFPDSNFTLFKNCLQLSLEMGEFMEKFLGENNFEEFPIEFSAPAIFENFDEKTSSIRNSYSSTRIVKYLSSIEVHLDSKPNSEIRLNFSRNLVSYFENILDNSNNPDEDDFTLVDEGDIGYAVDAIYEVSQAAQGVATDSSNFDHETLFSLSPIFKKKFYSKWKMGPPAYKNRDEFSIWNIYNNRLTSEKMVHPLVQMGVYLRAVEDGVEDLTMETLYSVYGVTPK